MNHAVEIIAALEKSYLDSRRNWSLELTGIAQAEDYHIVWKFGPQRLSGRCEDNVLTILVIELDEEIRGCGILTEVIERIRDFDPKPSIPLQFLHFRDCGPRLSRLLQRLGFREYTNGNAKDWWLSVTGQLDLFAP